MVVRIKEISETFTFEMTTVRDGRFTISKVIRRKYGDRWNVSFRGWIELTIEDENGDQLFSGVSRLGRNGMMAGRNDIEKYLGSYKPIRVTIIHYLYGRKHKIGIKVQKKTDEN
jgi:hypothetical protein